MTRRVCPLPLTAVLLLLLVLAPGYSPAQVVAEMAASVIVYEGDTLSLTILHDYEVVGKLPRRLAKQREQWSRLRYNVRKVYPYAVVAGVMLKDVDVELERRRNDRKARKAYINDLEKQLNQRFRGELENFSIAQGQILVKLINRQTGKNCFGIIKELKGGFSAVVFQSVALLFNNSLKREYDPGGNDREIETIVAELEAENYVRYHIQRQQQAARQ